MQMTITVIAKRAASVRSPYLEEEETKETFNFGLEALTVGRRERKK